VCLLDGKSVASSPGWQGGGDGGLEALEGRSTGSSLAVGSA